MDLIIEVYSNDIELAAESAAKYESQRMQTRDEVVEHWRRKVTMLIINDVQYIIFNASYNLK